MITFKKDPEKSKCFKPGDKLSPEQDLFMCCSWGKARPRFERMLAKSPDVNWKNEVGETALHRAAFMANPLFVRKLLEARADPNIPATMHYLTPLDMVQQRIDYNEERQERLGGWDMVNKLQDNCMHIRPDVAPWYECKELIIAAGGAE